MSNACTRKSKNRFFQHPSRCIKARERTLFVLHKIAILEISMSHTYNQSTGKFCNGRTGQCTASYSGYKGETDQTKKDAGPIPVGNYTVSNGCGERGGRCNLAPDASNSMFDRNNFQIHGDNGKGDKSASHGCIILNQADRAGLKPGDTVTVTK